MPVWAWAGIWGMVAGGALLVGAAVGYNFRLPTRLVASIMAFGSGVLLSALSFELMDEAYRRAGIVPAGVGLLIGAGVYTLANAWLSRRGARHRKRSSQAQVSEAEQSGSGVAIALGALLDGIPESIVIGLSLLSGKGVSLVTVSAIFISNVPEGLSSSAGMKKSGRSARYIFGVWGGIALISGLASLAGATLFAGLSPGVVAGTTAVAAGAILSMLVDTMIPEAYAGNHALAGPITVAGFLAAFALSKLGG
jgi:ZIP family zinc transporter